MPCNFGSCVNARNNTGPQYFVDQEGGSTLPNKEVRGKEDRKPDGLGAQNSLMSKSLVKNPFPSLGNRWESGEASSIHSPFLCCTILQWAPVHVSWCILSCPGRADTSQGPAPPSSFPGSTPSKTEKEIQMWPLPPC